ncbi:cold-shock protein [Mycobacterium bourgelatii]|uniref:CSD domain-containing protein n=1 Tax=Mycobacterium bourgelatii TaxID=1273442 RepID=A0A7I9YQZ5_MYCBU|nr:cold shock domain-containing protein [Mycobacterium bourgelatii]MCV6975120.1 cold shock domain-containing protein [Mycobacterium bourgelatii]GFG91002.1 hypothetical protein MBOU_30440 [Mycobacterium bourgelatii]
MVTTNSFDTATLPDLAIRYGTIRWFDGEHGYGFVQPADDGLDLFVDVSELIDPPPAGLEPGQPVSYHLDGTRHWPIAASVHAL